MSNLLITALGGWFGLHKFVQKKYKMGFLYLFTMGLFYIGWIVDMIIALIDYLKTMKIEPIDYFTVAGVSYCTEQIEFIMERNFRNADFVYKIRQDYAKLIPEPTNKYDKNAIKIVVDGVKIGYVPAEMTGTIKQMLKKDRYQFLVTIRGGARRYNGKELQAPFSAYINVLEKDS